MRKKVLKSVLIALMTAIFTVCAQLAIPIGGVPMTLQTFAAALCGYILGIYSIMAIFIYLLLGAVGLPVFAGFGASFAFLFGPTGGFLFGFLFLGAFCALASHMKSHIKAILISLIGLIICHVLGVLWFGFVSGNGILPSFLLTSLPYLLKDILSLIFAWILTQKLRQRYPNLLLLRHTS